MLSLLVLLAWAALGGGTLKALVAWWRNLAPKETGSIATAAKRAACELALTVLAPAGPPQLTILGHLEQNDKKHLSATCTTLREASLGWFAEATVVVKHGKTDVASLAAWLKRRQAQLHLIFRLHPDYSYSELGVHRGWTSTTIAALPAHLVSSFTAYQGVPAAGTTLTALTSLSFAGPHPVFNHFGVMRILRRLPRLRQLSLITLDVGSDAEELLAQPALTLQALRLPACKLYEAPNALAAFKQLTALDLSNNYIPTIWPLATLQRCQSLGLAHCSLTAVPEQFSALTALSRLNLSGNSRLNGSWQHLLPLTQLRDLNLDCCGLTAVMEQVSTLTALTSLALKGNKQLAGGWQHLLPLNRLRSLDLRRCSLTAVPEQVSALTALTRLDLSGNEQLDGGWQHLLPLTQLQGLDLRECGLRAVPVQLSALTALSCLNLKPLACGWQRLRNLVLPQAHSQSG